MKEFTQLNFKVQEFKNSQFIVNNKSCIREKQNSTFGDNVKKYNYNSRGITLIALVVTIVVLLILAGVTINTIFDKNGIIQKAQIAKNEMEIATIKEAINLYYLGNELNQEKADPILEQIQKEDIKSDETLEAIVEYQYGVENVDSIQYDRLYYLDLEKLGIGNVDEDKYFIDIETKIIYVNGGIKLSKGITYILEARDILPVQLAVEQVERGFKLVANAEEVNKTIESYNFYIQDELYKTVETSKTVAEIEVTDKVFGIYECYVKANKSDGSSDRSLTREAENYYIKDKTDMETFSETVNAGTTFSGKTIKVVNNINLEGSESNRNWTPIGNAEKVFEGIFEGNNYEISNIYNQETTGDYQGLFGKVVDATIKNITIKGDISANMYVSGLVAVASGNITITNCTNYINIASNVDDGNNSYTGGIIGWALNTENLIVENCNNYGNITKSKSLNGGIVGEVLAASNKSATIRNCNNFGNISSSLINSGGILGNIWETSNIYIENCMNYGEILGKDNAGGILGNAHISANVNINKCGNENAITADVYKAGGIVGKLYSCSNITITECYNNKTIIAKEDTAAGILAAIEASTEITIGDCYNTGNISNNEFVSGILGIQYKSTEELVEPNVQIYNCYNIGELTAEKNKDSILGGFMNGTKTITNCYYLTLYESLYGTAKTELEFQTLANTLGENWSDDVQNEDSSWKYNNGYPILNWQLEK